jgi:hypothetical protein
MKIRGTVGGIPVVLLIDSGATHNFLSKNLAEALGWEWENTKKMRILMGDGHVAETCGICRNIRIETEAGNFVIDVVLFELGDIDIVLGISWLRTLGEMTIDWSKKIMKFEEKGKLKTLSGMENEEPLLASLQGILDIDNGQVNGGLSQEKQRELEEVLNDFDDVFQEPKGLPQMRK